MSRVVDVSPGSPPLSPANQAQARRLRSLLVVLGRNLFSINDPVQDLPVRQLKTCMTLLHKSGPMSEISREIGVSVSAMTQIADRLERAGLVERVYDGADRRMRMLRLTATGERRMRAVEAAQLCRMEACLERLSDSEIHEVLAGLTTLVENSDPPETEFAPS